MESTQIEILPAAYEDLNDIFDYILLENMDAAELMLAKIINSLKQLEVFPKLGVKLMEQSLAAYKFRMMIIDSYIAFYRFIDNKVIVYRVLHGARDYVNLLGIHQK